MVVSLCVFRLWVIHGLHVRACTASYHVSVVNTNHVARQDLSFLCPRIRPTRLQAAQA